MCVGQDSFISRRSGPCGPFGGEADGDVDAARGVGGLLQEDGRGGGLGGEGDGEDVDWDAEALAREDGVHNRDVLVGEVGTGGGAEEEDPGLEACVRAAGGGGGGGGGAEVGGCGAAGGFGVSRLL